MFEILKTLVKTTGLSKRDFTVLTEAATTLEVWGPEVADIFYDSILAHQPTANLIQPEEKERHREQLLNWYCQLFTDDFSKTFWRAQWLVGLVHVKRNIPIHTVIAGMSRIQLYFLAKCLHEFEPDYARIVYGAFKRLTDVVTGLFVEGFFETYFEAFRKTSGIKQKVIHNMVQMELNKLIEHDRQQLQQLFKKEQTGN
ncbi:MAG: hypothetical protein KDE52_04265, partial [Calditrichaeota bacterium]|nr:hypothetical protein [Calditrichota bacterium]MCB0268577.1 hypothetical protein [Calditrichota bacterium]MCB0288181.1 hypothetical protein [Calditrichota bacterium]MCB0299244.1 hypothetical protein [Calditrichota bacterium]MCB9070535.1 hypothetical protein [Calditrichia bacterium]